MASGHVMLQQTEFPANCVGSFQQLRESGELLDVTLACEDETIEAHKVVLSACSPFFRQVLTKIKQKHPFIYLKGIFHKDLLAIMDYIYNGEAKVPAEDLKRFVEAAEELKIRGLAENQMGDGTKDNILSQTSKSEILEKFKSILKGSKEQEEITNMDEVSEVEHDIVENAERFGEHGLSMWKCKECGKVYKKKNRMKEHIKTHTFDIRKHLIKKEDDGVLVDVPITPEDSLLMYTGDDKEQYGKWRSEIFKRIKEFRDPKLGKMWKCTECGRIRKRKFKILSHVETHVKSLGLIFFDCNFCDKKCKTQDSLTAHVQVHHKDEKSKVIGQE